jgi:ribA/ribD-fused uncharacterized protein
MGTVSTQRISRFDGKEYCFLSNFFYCPVRYGWLVFPSAEHAYQAQKTLDPTERLAIQTAETPGKAKYLGRQVRLRTDWEQIKLRVMFDVVMEKFEKNLELRKRLLATGDAELVEGNTWGDRFWGVCQEGGENWLGVILMEVRERLREGGAQ